MFGTLSMAPIPKVLVTGGGGFVGFSLVRLLAAISPENVWVVDASPPPADAPAGIRWSAAGIGSGDEMRQALAWADVVVHCAWRGFPGKDIAAWRNHMENLNITMVLAELCLELGVNHLIFISSGGTVYGEADVVPTPEGAALKPINLYAGSKVGTEVMLSSLCRLGSTKLTILRLANPFGPYQLPWRGQGIISTAIACAMTGAELEIWGDDSPVRDYVYISDVASALYQILADPPATSGTYNLASSVGVSLGECLKVIEDVVGKAIERRYVSSRGIDVNVSILDGSAMTRDYGWKPQYSFTQGISMTARWLVDNRQIWNRPGVRLSMG